MFVETNTCLSRQNRSFVVTKVCLSQQNFLHDEHVFVTTNIILSQQTKFLSRFVVASILLLQQKTCFVTTNVFVKTKLVVTKIILVAAPANDSGQKPGEAWFSMVTTWMSVCIYTLKNEYMLEIM